MTQLIRPRVPQPRPVWLTAVAVFALGLLVGLPWIDQRTLWLDESATVIATTRSWSGLATLISQIDLVHAFYYALLHVWFELVGYSPFSLRAPSAVAAAAAAALLVPLGARLVSYRFGLIGACVFLATPAVLLAATNGRSQSFEMLAAVAATLLLTVALRRSVRDSALWTTIAWAGYAIVAYLGVLMNLWFIFLLAAHALTVLLLAGRRQEGRRGSVIGAVSALLGVAIASVPFALGAVGQSSQIGFLEQPTVKTFFLAIVRDQSFSLPLVHTGSIWPALLAIGSWLLALLGVVWLLRARSRAVVVLALWLLTTPVGLLAVSIAVAPTFSDRYLAVCIPALALLVAAGLTALSHWLRGALAVLAGIALLVFGAHAWQLVRWGDPATVDWRSAAMELERERLDDATSRAGIIYGSMVRPSLQLAVDYPEDVGGIADLTKTPPAPSTGFWAKAQSVGDAVGRAGRYDVVWYVGEPGSPEGPAVTSAMSGQGFKVSETTSFNGGVLVEYRKS